MEIETRDRMGHAGEKEAGEEIGVRDAGTERCAPHAQEGEIGTYRAGGGGVPDPRGYANEMTVIFDAVSQNESFARVAVAAFITPLNPTLEEVADVKTAVSEAVTNAVIHGYDGRGGKVRMHCRITGSVLTVSVEDDGAGIEDIERAMMPLFTTRPELDRSGMGFAFMEAFMDDLKVESAPGEGTRVRMMKKIGADPRIVQERP